MILGSWECSSRIGVGCSQKRKPSYCQRTRGTETQPYDWKCPSRGCSEPCIAAVLSCDVFFAKKCISSLRHIYSLYVHLYSSPSVHLVAGPRYPLLLLQLTRCRKLPYCVGDCSCDDVGWDHVSPCRLHGDVGGAYGHVAIKNVQLDVGSSLKGMTCTAHWTSFTSWILWLCSYWFQNISQI